MTFTSNVRWQFILSAYLSEINELYHNDAFCAFRRENSTPVFCVCLELVQFKTILTLHPSLARRHARKFLISL